MSKSFFRKMGREQKVKSRFARLFNSPHRNVSDVKKLHRSGRFI